ncbi:hypothetical protein MKK69_30840 [Methylobacterium sp. J-026]|uniref:hypothetical protein n=1 Tax=Methylobacterium sp. J-026 TaxID=2836624 RepID=UPI001FBA9314|nr:hypothetical protein [Methylobacterium sp. J-026]MCJ2138402.1 hypothetical protein [Methylobacterium sp. J-026]
MPLSQAFELILDAERDTILVERLLTPLLWSGQLPAVSRRAFVENELVNDLPVVTHREWRWAECPIIFDWQNSRGVLPRGTFRPKRDAEIVKFGLTEYFRIDLAWPSLVDQFPYLKNQVQNSSDALLRTGVVGHPTSRHVVEAEINRRANLGERYKTKSEAANALSQWLIDAYSGKAPSMSPKAMTNSLSEQLGALVDPINKPLPKSRPK